jgi:electron transfer flavoprotein alpha subunit
MKGVWTIAEQAGGGLKGVSFELLARGRTLADKLGVELSSVVLADAVCDDCLRELIERGADEVLCVEGPELGAFVCETYSAVIADLARRREPQIILAAATSSGRTLMPNLAVGLGTGLTADCTDLDIEPGSGLLLQTRPAIGGNIMATIKTPNHRPQMSTVRPKSARPLERMIGREGRIERLPLDGTLVDRRVEVFGLEKDAGDSAGIDEASIVVAGGKGLKKAENFRLIRDLAAALGGAVGASRDAVDRGWISYPHQVGLSGKTISPRLYLCAGVSGAIQHLAGIKTAECIVSINIDPDAPIHRIADLAIVGDLFEILPRLNSRLASGGRTEAGK